MKLVEIVNKSRSLLFKLQQALAELNWSCEFIKPIPFDTETGEIYPWEIIATNDDDDNKVTFYMGQNDPDVYTCTLAGHRCMIDTSLPVDQIAQKFQEQYDRAFSDLDEIFEDHFRDELRVCIEDELDLIPGDDDAEKLKKKSEVIYQKLKRTTLSMYLKRWSDGHEKLSNKLVNSRKLAVKLISKIEDSFSDVFGDEVENIEGRNV